ncbi:hypothetical protein [Chryseobacterium sp. G0201]|uniref:hypothetical protein n=1 Tax=Chryseobacterium sp. G0201 TaxID=2487065 RepID=UPI000F50D066|nr:hypothetical protein [Chryseobacterium sp. G0201]AZA52117.1 hypothetical protein EG348_03400 [Chryseobacterium sp. G0201]
MKFAEETEAFETKVRDIFKDISRHRTADFSVEKDEHEIRGFQRAVLDGFKVGQKKILLELRQLQEKSKEVQQELKIARQERNKELVEEILIKVKTIEYQESIFKNLADSIAWQMVNGEHYLYRRLYTGEEGVKDLLDKSFEYVINFSDQVNADPDAFCLISDITNNIQLGDCLITDKEGIKVSEIKSGHMNFKALDIIAERKLTDDNFDEKKLSDEFDGKFMKQIKRMVVQKGKTDRAAKIVQDHKGPDPKYKDTTIFIVENDFTLETYHGDLISLSKQLETKDWAYTSVGAIVHVGMYKNDWRIPGQFTLKQLCDPFPFVDLMASRGILICEPIFLKPFSEDIIMDIVFGRMKVYIGIDYNNFIKFSNDLGVKASWSAPKELQKYLEDYPHDRREIFSFENKGIKIEIDGNEIFVGHGFFTKILFDHFLPETMILKYNGTMENIGGSEE